MQSDIDLRSTLQGISFNLPRSVEAPVIGIEICFNHSNLTPRNAPVRSWLGRSSRIADTIRLVLLQQQDIGIS